MNLKKNSSKGDEKMIFRKENIKEMTTEDLNKVRVELLKKRMHSRDLLETECFENMSDLIDAEIRRIIA